MCEPLDVGVGAHVTVEWLPPPLMPALLLPAPAPVPNDAAAAIAEACAVLDEPTPPSGCRPARDFSAADSSSWSSSQRTVSSAAYFVVCMVYMHVCVLFCRDEVCLVVVVVQTTASKDGRGRWEKKGWFDGCFVFCFW